MKQKAFNVIGKLAVAAGIIIILGSAGSIDTNRITLAHAIILDLVGIIAILAGSAMVDDSYDWEEGGEYDD